MISNLKPYPDYKSSGVEWLGNVPAHWEVRRLRSLANITTGGQDTINQRDDGKYPFFVRSQTVERIDTWSFDGEAVLTAGDGVGVGKVFHYVNGKFDYHQRVYKFSDFSAVLGKFFFHYFKALLRFEVLQGTAKSTVDSLRLPMLQNFPVALPPLSEQTAIVRYLDYTDELIRRYISSRERLIELLEEYRQAVIHHAVTRGLDPDVRLKPSGVEWLGDVPAHWEVRRLRNVGEAIIGLTYAPQDVVGEEDGILVLRASNISKSQITYGDNVFVRCSVPDRLITQVGDILICSRSGSRALIGKNARIDSSSSGVTFGAFMTVFRCANNEYLHYVFNSKLFEYQSGAFLTSTINQLTLGMLYSIKIPLPPLPEQKRIIHYLDKATADIDVAIDRARREIELLEEYRTRLIADVVTGKGDVREAVVDLPQ